MKKILSIIFLFCFYQSFGQTPVGIGNANSYYFYRDRLGADSGFVYKTHFVDTVAANKGVIKNYPGLSIFAANRWWIRNSTALAWLGSLQIGEASGSGTDNTELGTGYQWLYTPSQGIKSLIPGFGFLADSTADDVTVEVDSTVVATRYSLQQYDSLELSGLDSLVTYGDSYTSGYAAGPGNVIYPNRLRDSLGLLLLNKGTNSAGWYTQVVSIYQRNYWSVTRNGLVTSLTGIQDMFSNLASDRNKRKMYGLSRTFVSNLFLDTAISFSDASVTKSGFSNSTVACQAKSIALGGAVVISTASGSTASFSFTGDNLVIGTFATTLGTTIGGFTVVIDGVTGFGGGPWRTYNGSGIYPPTGTYYAIANEGTLTIYPDVIIIRGLTAGAHTCVITSNSTSNTYLDYFGVMDVAANVKPVVIGTIAHVDENVSLNYSLIYNPNYNTFIDQLNATLYEAMVDFADYPLSFIDVNKFYSPYTGVNRPDNLHPNIRGQYELYEAFRYGLKFRTFDKPKYVAPKYDTTFVTSIRRSNDSVYFVKNGISTFAYIDSTGGGTSSLFPLTGTGTATGAVTGDLDGNNLQAINADHLYFHSKNTSVATNIATLDLHPPSDGTEGTRWSYSTTLGENYIAMQQTAIDIGLADGDLNIIGLDPWAAVDTTKKPLVIGAGGKIEAGNWAYAGSGGGTPTLQQVITAGATLTTSNTIDQGTNNLLLSNTSRFYITTPTRTLLDVNASGAVALQSPGGDYQSVVGDTYNRMSNGAISRYFEVADSLREWGLGLRNDTTGWRIQTINPVTGAKSYANWLYAGSGGGGLTIGDGITSGTAGRMLFESATNTLAESAQLTYDDTKKVFDVTGMIRAGQYTAAPTTLTAIELYYLSATSTGYIHALDRAATVYKNLELGGQSTIVITRVGAQSITMNSLGSDIDFFVEGDTDPNLLKADAGLDVVSVGGVGVSGQKLSVYGNLNLVTAGNKINIATGTNASVGISGAMTAGSITISTTAVTANSIIQLTPVGAGSGQISIGTITAGTSFVINSSDGADTRIVHWQIIN